MLLATFLSFEARLKFHACSSAMGSQGADANSSVPYQESRCTRWKVMIPRSSGLQGIGVLPTWADGGRLAIEQPDV
jgi:hypothetical protein